MPLPVKDSGGQDFDPVPQGTHLAVCYMVADIGQQMTNYGPKHKVVVGFEIPGKKIKVRDEHGNEIEKPMIINNFYTASLSNKAILRKDLEGWRGKTFTEQELQGFDLFNVLGHACLLTVVHNIVGDKTYANIAAVSKLMDGMVAPQPTRALKYSPDEQGQYKDLPEWVQKKISGQVTESENPAPDAHQYEVDARADAHSEQQQAAMQDFDDDIPF